MTKRALVLGGGGPVGIGWEAGLISGLMKGGVDLSQADLIVGTSAGSFVGAYLAMGNDIAQLAETFSAGEPQPVSTTQPAAPAPDLSILIGKLQEAVSGVRPAKEVRAEIGAWALTSKTISEQDFIASLGGWLSGLPENAWPGRPYACTAVDAADGSFTVWSQEAGIGLARAVASSCSVPGIFPPITIRGRRYIDGGMRSATNADVAKGYDSVLVVAVTVRVPDPTIAERFRKPLENEMKVLRESGARVELIMPDEASLDAFGINLMDRSRRPAAAKAGLSQGRADAARLRSFWS
ncbi:MAG TPA: patatin-like phospholipase family protein [Candidatus Saccharimonadales bacterium]|nr:patatin-like phospholipase family protein [Candidatus Saccharimonadales bacterium]